MSMLDDIIRLVTGGDPPRPGDIPGVPPVCASVSIPLGSGYNTAADRAGNALRLRAACDAAISNPRWRPGQPFPGDTHCNGAAAQIADAMGCHDLDNLMANQQIMRMQTIAPAWRMDTPERAVQHAQNGGLAFATLSEFPHGHLAAVYPDPMERSDTWGTLVPIIANVGHENKRCRLSGGFKEHTRPMIRFFLLGAP